MTLDQVNEALKDTEHLVTLVSVPQPNGDAKAMYRWSDDARTPLFDRGTISSLIEAAKEELGTRFIRQHGLDAVVTPDTLRDGGVSRVGRFA